MSEELLKKQLAEAMKANAELKRRLQKAYLEIKKLREEMGVAGELNREIEHG